jgi:hypothetical protein
MLSSLLHRITVTLLSVSRETDKFSSYLRPTALLPPRSDGKPEAATAVV